MRLGFLVPALLLSFLDLRGEDWPQLQFDSGHSGNAADRTIDADALGLVGAVAFTDGLYSSPVIAEGLIYAIDGSGLVRCLSAETLETVWEFQTRGGKLNCNNVGSPAIVQDYLHVGTTAGYYYVFDR
jgi:outer membrane protein assembly factor BamB